MKEEFKRRKKFLVCVDSDGCAMDTMNIKHKNYFGPLVTEVFDIKDKETFLKNWDKVNLYSRTRGINRFKGLVLGLQDAKSRGEEIIDISNLIKWTETTKELSNASLKKEIEFYNTEDLKRALEWSFKVNTGIEELVGKDAPFENVKEFLAQIHKFTDVAIVSAANSEALYSEWARHNLLEEVDVVFGQEAGTKAHCIETLKSYGYKNDEILMVGDAPGDLQAAKVNGVFFYPILFGQEKYSWEELVNEALGNLTKGAFTREYQEKLIKEFEDLLDKQ